MNPKSIDLSTSFENLIQYQSIPPINGREIVRFNCLRKNAVGNDKGHGEEWLSIFGVME